MSVTISSNLPAAMAANHLAYSSQQLEKSLNRLSSGSKIVNPSDDAGGLAVSMKLSATANREADLNQNLSDATSFAQTQDGALQVAGTILDRISQLTTLASDPTKNTSDLANYNDEFTQLQAEITALSSESFNGIPLFGSQAVSVQLDDGGNSSMNVGGASLMYDQSGSVTDDFSDNFTDSSDSGATTAMTPSSVVMTSPDAGTYALISSNQTFTGPVSISATFDIAPGGPGEIGIQMGSDIDFSEGRYSVGPGTHTLNMTVDQSGNWTQSLDDGTVFTGAFSGFTEPQTVDFYFSNHGAPSATLTHATIDSGQSNLSTVATATSLGSLSLATVTDALQDVASMRAVNGAEQSRLNFASTMLTTNRTNLQSAISNITDVDVAAESTNLARYNVLVQAGTSMLTQANQSAQTALKLITG